MHIDTISPKQRDVILDYIHMKGFKLGKSSFKKVPQTYKLADNERWAEKKPQSKTATRSVEIIEEAGLINTYQLRDELNIQYFLDLEAAIPEWPIPFKHQKVRGLF